ncbi:MAG: helix-turn-helix transcriptional regulator, partial [Verrucomicrobiae bacterium]|nr:helix-turn-helix transcriptional regulator [Verrucomicrobiae bacterium]
KITLNDLSRFAGVSVRTLSTMFVSGTGFPPMRYLIELRLNHAMKLLRHTGHSIDQIADECGFPNRYYFTRMLAKYRKTTPAAFRARSDGGD